MVAHQEVLSKASPSLDGLAAPVPGQQGGTMVAVVPPLSSGTTPGTAPKVAASLLGPPPRSKAPQEVPVPDVGTPVVPIPGGCTASEGNMVSAITQQCTALLQLVAHMTGGDPTSELASSSSAAGLGLNTKGVARRERMQSDLAHRNSNYFLQVQQQLFKRMNPARAIPKTHEELAQADISMTAYLERYGGFRHCKETGMIMWILAHAMDAAAMDDFLATKEYLALLTASLEQSALDNNWGVAYVLSLMEEPPQQLFAERMQPLSATGRPFAPLVPPSWAAVALSYIKELEVLTTRKVELKKPAYNPPPQSKQNAAAGEVGGTASPKRKPKFPRKPKAGGESPQGN